MKKDTLKNWLIVLLVLIFVSALLFEWFSRYTTTGKCTYVEPKDSRMYVEPLCLEYKVFTNVSPKICSILGRTWGEICADNFDCVKGCFWEVVPR